MVRLALAPADRDEHRAFANAGMQPGERVDCAVRGLDPHPGAVNNAERRGLVRMDLAVQIGPQLLRLPA